jgi:glutathione S-transferase
MAVLLSGRDVFRVLTDRGVDAERARETRMRDRFFDLYVNAPMQKIVMDRMRPSGQNDSYGVQQAKTQLQTALQMIEHDMANKTWAMGDEFTIADCAAATALWFANQVVPFVATHPSTTAYLQRLTARPSYARAIKEAQPYLALVPK